MALTPLAGTLSEKQAAHLLRRVTFGPTIKQIKDFTGLTVTEAMDKLFTDPYPLSTDSNYPKPPIDTVSGKSWVLPEQRKAADEPTNSGQDTLHSFFKAWYTDVMLKSDDPTTGEPRIKERLAWFFHTHLPARWTKIRSSEAIFYQNCVFRHYALGSFKEMFKKICIDNAMLKYLDNGTNKKNAPNENFARELFELYSIGRGKQVYVKPADGEPDDPNKDYTNFKEEDIKAATKVLTGWIIDNGFENDDADHGWPSGKLDASGTETLQHDGTDKTFSTHFGSQTITGGTSVIEATAELDALMDLIFDQDKTAKAITRKLYRFFVYHFIDEDVDQVESTVITPLATTLKDNNYNLELMLRELFSSQFFYDANEAPDTTPNNNIGALIKSPIDLVLGTLRFFETATPDRETQTQTFYDDFLQGILPRFKEQGLNYYEPFEVAGYPPYHQKPAYGRNWIMPAELAYRYQTGERLMKREGYPTDNLSFTVDVLAWLKTQEDAGYVDATVASNVVDFLDAYFVAVDLHADRKTFLLDSVFLKDSDAATWTSDWANYTSGGSNVGAKAHLERLVSGIMQTPEYQLH